MVFLDTTCVTTITAGTLNSFDLAWSTSHLYVQTFSRSSYNSKWVFFYIDCHSTFHCTEITSMDFESLGVILDIRRRPTGDLTS